jgi:hypothetical protein
MKENAVTSIYLHIIKKGNLRQISFGRSGIVCVPNGGPGGINGIVTHVCTYTTPELNIRDINRIFMCYGFLIVSTPKRLYEKYCLPILRL